MCIFPHLQHACLWGVYENLFFLNKTIASASFRISLIRSCEKLPAQEHFIVQEYLDKPFLLEGYKFDLRIYILVTTCDPLRIFLYNDGLVRMGTEKYHAPNEANLVSQHCGAMNSTLVCEVSMDLYDVKHQMEKKEWKSYCF